MAILTPGSYVFVPTTKNKKTEQISKTLQLVLYSPHNPVFITMFGYTYMMFKLHKIIFASQKKESPQVLIITLRQKQITQSFPGSIFLKNLSLWGPFSPNKRKIEFSAKIRFCQLASCQIIQYINFMKKSQKKQSRAPKKNVELTDQRSER